MAKNADQIVVAANGGLNVAPEDTTLPDDLEDLGGTYVDLGYINEDGATITKGRTVEEVRSWQSATAVRKFVTEESLQIEAALQQWNAQSFITAFGGGEWTEPDTGVFRYDPPAPEDALIEQVVVLDWQDGEREWRLIVPKMTVEEDVETQLQRTTEQQLPTTLSAVADDSGSISWYLLSNDSAFDVGS